MTEEITKQTQTQPGDLLPPEPDARALNAVSHGLTAQHVPPGEREEYARHAQQIREATGAQNYLEQRLADRAALALWRLDRVAKYEAAQSEIAQRTIRGNIARGATGGGPAGLVTAAYEVLGEAIGYLTQTELQVPAKVEEAAQDLEGEAALLFRVAQGGTAEGLSEDEAETVGRALFELLSAAHVTPREMAQAMLGRRPKRADVESVEDESWIFEPLEVPGLLALYRERLPELGGRLLENAARHKQAKADLIRAAHKQAQDAQRTALAGAALPDSKQLEKITRYEAHLERVLYRALHDLEAARLGREGKNAPPPLRGVLDERPSE